MLLYIRNIPSKYNIPLIKEETLMNLLAKGLNQTEIAKKVGHSNSTVCRSIKGYGMKYHKPPPKWKPKPKSDDDMDEFKIKVKRNYTQATVFLHRHNCKYFPKNNHHKRVLVMDRGELKNTEVAIRWWNEKIEKAWERRHYYGGML